MKKTNIHNKPRIIFSRWTRKAYAVFASLGREVSIGHVSVGIADCAYAKNCFVNVADMGVMDRDNEESGTETFALLSELELMFSNLLETLFAAFAIVTLKNDDSQLLAVNDINKQKSRVPKWESGFSVSR